MGAERPLKPAPFLYARPDSLDEAIRLLIEHGDEAKVLAGGQSLVPLLNLRLARPGLLVDIGSIPGLTSIAVVDGQVRVGAMARQRVVEESAVVAMGSPLLRLGLGYVGHIQIRNQGTVGGSVAHADPAAELPAIALALEAEMVMTGPDGIRTVSAETFFTGPFTTAIASNEILTEVRFSTSESDRVAFAEVARRSGDFAIAGVATVARVGQVRLAACGVAWTPVRLAAAERVVAGRELSPQVIREAAVTAREEVDPAGDVHGDVEYRRELIEVLVTRTLEEVAA